MAAMAVVVFIALFFIKAGYGYFSSSKWGWRINNKIAWILMEAPAFLLLLFRAIKHCKSGICTGNEPVVLYSLAAFYLLHYFQRSFIFPLLMRGKSRTPITIILLSVIFNSINAYIIGEWLFCYAPAGMYTLSWFTSWKFILGAIIFIAGMAINLDSDNVIRHLRAPGDTKHYIPKKHLYKYVTSANYFGELTEWIGFAILTWSPAGLLFAVWTFANLAPRAWNLTKKYEEEFGQEYKALHKKHLIPFIW